MKTINQMVVAVEDYLDQHAFVAGTFLVALISFTVWALVVAVSHL